MQLTSKFLLSLLLISCVGLTGCYQAKVTTDRPAGDTVVEKKWASSFIGGLVPAKIDVSDQCANGISSAERKFRFVNMLVSGFTFGIYYPQTVKVTCASGGEMTSAVPTQDSDFTVSETASKQRLKATLSKAATKAAMTQNPVEVQVATN